MSHKHIYKEPYDLLSDAELLYHAYEMIDLLPHDYFSRHCGVCIEARRRAARFHAGCHKEGEVDGQATH